MNFVAKLGVKDLEKHISQASKVKYLSSSSVTQMVNVLSDYLERMLLKDLNEVGQYSLLSDESSDRAHRSQMSVMARFSRGTEKVATHFLGFVQLERGTAEAIMEALSTFLLDKNISMQDLLFMAFDGCNTMSGVQKGKL